MFGIRGVVFLAAGSLIAIGASAQQDVLHPKDTSALHPPPGAKIAIVEFADLECPSCAMENPVIMQAVEKYHVAWERHDFPLPQHNWSFQAAVNARWFDTKSKKLGDDYRNAVFANQSSIETKSDLQNFTMKFAQEHDVALPFVMDPQGKLTAEVKADQALGDRMGIHETPTAWVVTEHGYKQITNFQDLYSMLDQAEAGH
ncbi:MAG TPA: thioredoxin domain-containing protein [Acidobacteriaceae bacterium]|nr:thioredoxin domain-containing protein [Acidobacteriaceae bacterium]